MRAVLHWVYERQRREGVELSDVEGSLLAYWGYPEGHPLASGRETSDPRPAVISGAKLAETGKWTVDGNNCQLIQHLIGSHLIHVDQRGDGWTKLYQDPRDGAYWELTYPHGDMHGGGPPTLSRRSIEEVRALYHLPSLERH